MPKIMYLITFYYCFQMLLSSILSWIILVLFTSSIVSSKQWFLKMKMAQYPMLFLLEKHPTESVNTVFNKYTAGII